MNKKGWFVTIVAFLAAFLLGDLVMWAATSAIKHFVGPIAPRLILAVLVIWLGSFLTFGCPQIWAWRKKQEGIVPDEDLRMKWAVRGFSNGGIIGYLAGCFAAGPVAMGFYTGQSNDPKAYRKTLIASLVFALLWGPWYIVLGRAGFVVVIAFVAIFVLAGRRSLRTVR